ncbi:MAG TPA: radical SAM protein [Clostridia bacterium]|nr:radical SAM protein [Clostridia bacterium]
MGAPYHEIGPIRPPNEGSDRSLLLRLTRNCPWNRCAFCATYKGKRFSLRSIDEIKRDIDAVKTLAEALKAESWRMGFGGAIRPGVVKAVVENDPRSYDPERIGVEAYAQRLQSLINVADWVSSGAKTVFLQDANSPQMPLEDLVSVLTYLKNAFPQIERITSYARSKTIFRKPVDDLVRLREAGLSRIHMGVESGCDEVLSQIQKGVTGDEHIAAGKKAREAGLEVCAYVMPGLGGKRLSERHALETARVLNEMEPHFIRLRTLVPRLGTPLWEKLRSGEFEALSEDEAVEEIALLIQNLKCRSYLASDQVCNLLWAVEGKLPDDKPVMLKVINDYLRRPPLERLRIQMRRRLAAYRMMIGEPEGDLGSMVAIAEGALDHGYPDVGEKVARALDAIKQFFI